MQSPPLEDRWLAEVTYKNCVKHGMSFVKDRLHSLKQAIDDVVSLDSQRLTRTKQILLSFLPRRRRLFLRVHESFQSTADKLNDERQGMEEVESQLDKVLEQLSRRNLSKRNRSSIMNRSRTWNMGAGDSGSPQNRSEATPTLPECNMLESSHILERKAVEVKMGAKGEWQLALALLTDDKYLHVLVYDSELPTDLEESQAETVLALKLKGKLPNLSVSRLDCNASLVPNKDHIELLVEGSSPLQKMLKRKVFLRLSSPSETSSWFDAHLHSWSSSTTDTESSTSSLFV